MVSEFNKIQIRKSHSQARKPSPFAWNEHQNGRQSRRVYKSPTIVNLEVTDICNERCVYCYNFDRSSSMGNTSLNTKNVDNLINQFVTHEVFHVVASGGEAFANFEVLLYLIEQLQKNDISISINSNLSIKAKRKDRLKTLYEAGCDHILTSLPSNIPELTNLLVNSPNAHERIITGIKEAVNTGFRVSVNTVVHNSNKDQVYATAKLVHELGCDRIMATRIVAPDYRDASNNPKVTLDENPNVLSQASALECLDQLLKARDDFGIDVSTLVSYPLCLLGDLEKYSDFVGRGCPTQRGHRVSILPNGDFRSCVHLSKEILGNVLKGEDDIRSNYHKMRDWHEGKLIFDECKICDYRDICNSGCRVDAQAFSGGLTGRDPLMVGPIIDGKIHGDALNDFVPLKITYDKAVLDTIAEKSFYVNPSARFRYEDDFYLCSIKYGNIIELENDIGEFLIKKKQSGEIFTAKDFGKSNLDLLANYFCKDLLVSTDEKFNSKRNRNMLKKGLGIDPRNLPYQ